MRSFVAYFCRKPLMVNVFLCFVLASAVVVWTQIGKEELPEFSMNFLRCSIIYPGASAGDVELFVTKPIEEQLKGVSGIYELTTTSSYGVFSMRASVDPFIRDNAFRQKVQDIKDAIDRAELPREIEDPVYSQFNSDEKAILDLGIYLEGTKILDVPSRQKLQSYALALKNQLLTLPEVSGVESNAYLQPEIHIKIDPKKLQDKQISMSQVGRAIQTGHIRVPAGNMTDIQESEVSLLGELNTLESIDQTVVQAGFEGQQILVSDLGGAEHGFMRTNRLLKVQGHEAVVFNIQKSSSADILTAQETVENFISTFNDNHKDQDLRVVMMDDESFDVRNRLSIIGSNGIIGFVLIVFVLFLFLNLSTGFWVALGIPFSLSITLVGAALLGFTINNMTLASIIIVLGIVVDDAIIVAEKIARVLETSKDKFNDAVDATVSVFKPVLASILTTCAAFLPLYFFEGRFGLFVKYIPTVIFLMLFASLIESACILPTHMVHPIRGGNLLGGLMERFSNKRKQLTKYLESKYQKCLLGIVRVRYVVILLFIAALGYSLYFANTNMKYVMFPREETKEIAVRVKGPQGINRYQMAELMVPLENIFLEDTHVVEAVRTRIGQSRRGSEVRENEGSLRVELIPPDQRTLPLRELIPIWEEKANQIEGLTEVRFSKSWWSSDSGSPIELEVRENNDDRRAQISEQVAQQMREISGISLVEIEKPVTKRQYQLHVDKAQASKLDVDLTELASTVRGYVEGNILYTLIDGDEEVDVRLTSQDADKDSIEEVMRLSTSNQDQYLVPIDEIVTLKKTKKPSNIARTNFKRATKIYADLEEGAEITPLEVAEVLERDVFPSLIRGNPTTAFAFRGEIEDSREAQGDFLMSIVLVLMLIYVLLVFLFDSLLIPSLIGFIIPFGFVGVIWAFSAHGMDTYGFFAVVGTLGMIGVVVNDAIVMVDTLENEISKKLPLSSVLPDVVAACVTRLRPIILTTLTTIAGIFPTAYGIAGYDSMLAEMMLAMGWGLLFGTTITLILVPCLYVVFLQIKLPKETAR